MNTKNNDKDLFEPLASIGGADTEPARRPALGDVTDDTAKKKPEPRNNKPQAYYLYRDDELLDAYESAADSFKGLANERFKEGNLRIMAPDQEGTMQELATKEKDTIDIVNLLKASREIAVYSLSDDFRHDLNAEGFKTDRAREGVIEAYQTEPVQEKPQPAPTPRAPLRDLAPGELLPEIRELIELSSKLDAARATIPKTDWERLMREATREPQAAEQKPEQQSEFKQWLAKATPRQPGTDSEVERVKQVQVADVSVNQAQGPELDYGQG